MCTENFRMLYWFKLKLFSFYSKECGWVYYMIEVMFFFDSLSYTGAEVGLTGEV